MQGEARGGTRPLIGGDGCSGVHLKGEPRGEVIPRKRLRGDDVDTAAGGGYTRGREGTSARKNNTRNQRKSSKLQKTKP